jgi:hypothetical protein
MRFCRLAIALRFANWRWPATGNFRVLQLALLPENLVDLGIRFAPGPGAACRAWSVKMGLMDLKVSDLTDQKLSESPFDIFAAKSYQIRKWYDSCWR